MYVSTRDSNGRVGVGIFHGRSQNDADYQAAIDDVAAGNRAAKDVGQPSVFVLFVDREVPSPPAVWRKRFSEANQALAHVPHYMLLVTESAPMRGVFTAVLWVTGAPRGHTYKAVASASDADAWLTAHLGEQFAVATRLETEVRTRSRRAASG